MRQARYNEYPVADEGQGDVLHDRSGNENHGTIYHVPWEDGLLNFTSSTYQWAEIPAHPGYRSEEFTIGGWVFSRREGYVSDRHQSGMRFFGDSRNPWWHIPGSWERMGASRDSGDDDYPAMLYWVSENRGDSGSRGFASRQPPTARPRDHPKRCRRRRGPGGQRRPKTATR